MADPPAAPCFAGLSFNGTWRDYQARLLTDVDGLLADRRLHIVAAPGSGKTTLGLEVMRRIARPALALAPTVTIRNQWVDRLRHGFLAPGSAADWISLSLAEPGLLTVSTYQALHAAWADEDGTAFAALAEALKVVGPVTLLLDEAHHLRREWWRALQALAAAVDPVIVSLTATPPYDVPPEEWRRYEDACGPIDAEISIPELVRNGDLCPHQDYLLFSLPGEAEAPLVAVRREGLTQLFEMLLADKAFADRLATHDWIADPAAHEEAILESPEFLSAMLIFLAASGRPVPHPPLALLGARRADLPRPSPRWMEILLEGILFTNHDTVADGPWRTALKADLQRLGAIEGGRVRIIESAAQFTLMASSIAKLDSIARIARAEAASLGSRLRMVVLTDFVRASDLPRGGGQRPQPAKLGVASIFDTLRLAGIPARLGVLSGSLVILPDAALAALHAAAALSHAEIQAASLDHCPGYLRVTASGANASRLVDIVTRLFAQGDVTLLVGTQALLGEGWDAPSVNTLVLASNTGAYMLSNQMRGRAIRIDPADPAKVANIWHLATVTPAAPDVDDRLRARFDWSGDVPASDPIGQELGPDMALVKRRFDAFSGLSLGPRPRIESGIARLGIAMPAWNAATIAALDEAMLARAADRPTVASGWRAALGEAAQPRRMRQVARPNYAPRFLATADTLLFLAVTGLGSGLLSAGGALRQFGSLGPGTLLLVFGGLTLFYALPNLARAGWLLCRNGSLERSLAQVGRALLEALDDAELLPLDPDQYDVEITQSLDGVKQVTLHNADRATERLFLGALAEILGPVANPRYLLVRKTRLGTRSRADYHAVPSVLGQRKEFAKAFAARWRANVGRSRLVFIRTPAGRHVLLHARMRSFAAGFQREVDRLSAWE